MAVVGVMQMLKRLTECFCKINCLQVASLPEFKAAAMVKVNPDTPQKEVRRLILNGNNPYRMMVL